MHVFLWIREYVKTMDQLGLFKKYYNEIYYVKRRVEIEI